MKIIFDDNDKTMIEKFKNGEMYAMGVTLPFLGEDSEKCSLELKINDSFKCAVFLSELFYSLRDYTKEECGFEVGAVSLIGVHSDLENLSSDIMDAVASVLEKHNL